MPAPVVDRARKPHRRRPESRALLRADAGCRRLLEHLLMTPLHRAVALEQMHDLAVAVAEHLHLDVPRRLEVALEQHALVAERRVRLASRSFERGGEIVWPRDHAHALAAAAGHGLEQHRSPARAPPRAGSRRPERRRGGPDQGHVRRRGHRLGAILGAHGLDRFRARPDEDQTDVTAGPGEARVLGEKAIGRVDRLRAGTARRVQDRIRAQIAFARGRRADPDRLVRLRHMQGALIGIGIDRGSRGRRRA